MLFPPASLLWGDSAATLNRSDRSKAHGRWLRWHVEAHICTKSRKRFMGKMKMGPERERDEVRMRASAKQLFQRKVPRETPVSVI